jgi:septal ring factor EnvC (AmiA/AmiB activator)
MGGKSKDGGKRFAKLEKMTKELEARLAKLEKRAKKARRSRDAANVAARAGAGESPEDGPTPEVGDAGTEAGT